MCKHWQIRKHNIYSAYGGDGELIKTRNPVCNMLHSFTYLLIPPEILVIDFHRQHAIMPQ